MPLHIETTIRHYGPLNKYLYDSRPLTSDGREVDFQRQKLYSAEEIVESTIGVGETGLSIDDMKEICESATSSNWWRRRFGYAHKIEVFVSDRHYYSHAFYPEQEIFITENYSDEMTLYHELAHCVVPTPHAWHGRLFARIYLDLVRQFMGQKHAKALEGRYLDNGVRFDNRKRGYYARI